MGKRNVGNCLDFRHFEYSKIGLPLVEAIERIMIGAEVVGQASPANADGFTEPEVTASADD